MKIKINKHYFIRLKDGTDNSAMQRGYLREEILAPSSSLKIDVNYYLHQQILPVISRLLEPFDGTDQAFLAQCLGLDSSKYKQRQGKTSGSKHDYQQDLLNDDENDVLENDQVFAEGSETYKLCDPFAFPCPQCETLNFWQTPFVFNEVCSPCCLNDNSFVSVNILFFFQRTKHVFHHFFAVQITNVRHSQLTI